MYTVDALLAGQWDTFVDALSHLALPGLVLTLYTVGLLIRFARSAMLDVLGQDYVTRRARQGAELPARSSSATCCAARSCRSSRSSVSPSARCCPGTVLTEQVFSWGGIGQYAYKAATTLDLPAVMGVGLIVGIVYIIINFVIDVIYGVVDPRVRVQ